MKEQTPKGSEEFAWSLCSRLADQAEDWGKNKKVLSTSQYIVEITVWSYMKKDFIYI